jgi:hypothetical protein
MTANLSLETSRNEKDMETKEVIKRAKATGSTQRTENEGRVNYSCFLEGVESGRTDDTND